MKATLFFGLVSAETYKFITWNLAGINNNRFEFHNNDNRAFIGVLETQVHDSTHTIDHYLTPVRDRFTGCHTSEFSGDSKTVKELFIHTELDKKQKAEIDAQKKFYTMVSDADRAVNERPTFANTPNNMVRDAFMDKWFEEVINDENKSKLEKQMKLRDESSTDICPYLFYLYVRDIFLFDAKLQYESEGKQMLAPLPENNKNKLQSLFDNYKDTVDIFALQETNPDEIYKFFDDKKNKDLKSKFNIISRADTVNANQACVLLLHKDKFTDVRVLHDYFNMYDKDDKKNQRNPVKEVVVTAKDKSGQKIIIASYHAESNGQDSTHFVSELYKQFSEDSVILLGMDANTDKSEKQKDNLPFTKFVSDSETVGYDVAMKKIEEATTKKVRTMVQWQIKKGVELKNADEKIEEHPKDNILSVKASSSHCFRDNTFSKLDESKRYEDRPLPDEKFLSDHAIVVCDVTTNPSLTRTKSGQGWDKSTYAVVTVVILIIGAAVYFFVLKKQ